MTDYRKLCIEIFGTDDETELREIADRQRSGRKKALSKRTLKLLSKCNSKEKQQKKSQSILV